MVNDDEKRSSIVDENECPCMKMGCIWMKFIQKQ